MRILIAGGGTGGHIFPAIAIAQALQRLEPKVELLFVGAKGKMEMEKVPQAGYRIEGLDIAGFNRTNGWKNLSLPFKLIKSFFQVRQILGAFKPDAVVGVGGYSSFPVLKYAQQKGIPSFIHESNAFAGKSNQLLGKGATRIYVAHPGMESFFPADKIKVTGNPVRKQMATGLPEAQIAKQIFGLNPHLTTVLVTGGSLGARSINEAVDAGMDQLLKAGLQVIWQTGKQYTPSRQTTPQDGRNAVWVGPFITRMEEAFAAADLVVSRAGAMAIAELCVVGRPVVLVPYPLAAEDHQTVNAQSLVNDHAACMIADAEVGEKLIPTVLNLADDEARRKQMAAAIQRRGVTDADEAIAHDILTCIYKRS